MSNLLIEKTVVVKYKVKLITGLHIGGSKEAYGIGGVDAPVIKNPLNNQPIIPGSSIKGKMRLLLKLTNTSNKVINKCFGVGQGDKNNPPEPFSRIIFRDLVLTKESVARLEISLGEGFYTEIKAENRINRENGTAIPRFIERVPAEAEFHGDLVINYLKEDSNEDFEALVKQGFKLLEDNYLGGSGTRGYGKVKITVESSPQ